MLNKVKVHSKIAVHCMQLTHAASTTKRSFEDQPIKYPGPIQDVSNRYGTDDVGDGDSKVVPEQCKSKSFCTIKPPDYPEKKFNDMFKGYKAVPHPTFIPEEDDAPNRQGDPSGLDDCDSIVTYEKLYQVRSDRGGVWRTVIQAPEEDFIQRVRLEECKSTSSKCFNVFADLGIETFCKQKYSNWEVLVSDGKSGSEKIKARLPICCSCHYKI